MIIHPTDLIDLDAKTVLPGTAHGTPASAIPPGHRVTHAQCLQLFLDGEPFGKTPATQAKACYLANFAVGVLHCYVMEFTPDNKLRIATDGPGKPRVVILSGHIEMRTKEGDVVFASPMPQRKE